ncbi:CynX/NimT family MFS transporter [Bailinhaonella thermotolerans]|uniref:MFS transporter n=1 Tax=Bailinhaonella thermotolerans TaxID=1070861 RepID=A0A3A4B8D6_9ACTN|nr:MFS transporter [Bailinhaonella thermotolerans]RJL34491.1 MFS transporter [Bailinhaonella thermotolerans]
MSLLAPEKPGVALRASRNGSMAWLLVLGIVLAALNLRTGVTSVGPLLGEIRDSLGLSGASTGLLTTLPVLMFASVGALTPTLARRFGDSRLLFAALGTLGAGLAVRSVVGHAGVFLLASAVALAGGAVGNVLIPTLIKKHFPTRVGLMTTVYTTALAVGTMLAAAATVPIEKAAGSWHVALGVWAAFAAVAVLPWLALVRGSSAGTAGRSPYGLRFLVRSKLAWAVAGYFGTQSLVAYVMFGWLAQILRDNGYSAGEAGALLSLFTGLSIPISLVLPALTARMRDQRPVVAALVALYVIGFAGLQFAPASTMAVWVVVVALGMGSFPLALMMFALRTRTAPATAALSAFGQSVGYLIAGVGPLLVGVLYESTGGWTAPFVLLYATVAAQLLFGLYAARGRYLEDA